MLSNIIVELPWNSLMAVILFFTWYYPIGMFRNAIPAGQVHERGALMFLLIWGKQGYSNLYGRAGLT